MHIGTESLVKYHFLYDTIIVLKGKFQEKFFPKLAYVSLPETFHRKPGVSEKHLEKSMQGNKQYHNAIGKLLFKSQTECQIPVQKIQWNKSTTSFSPEQKQI